MSSDRLSAESQADAQARWDRLRRLSLEPAERPTWARERRRQPRRFWPIVLALLTFLAGVFVGAKAYGAERVSVTTQPHIMIRRGDIRVDARVEHNAENRLLSIAWTSDVGSTGSTLRELAGEDAPLVTTLWLRDQPAAHYLFVATLINKLGKIAGRAETEILVPDNGGLK